jgi:hypothetical protein
VPLNDRDEEQARFAFERYSEAEQEQIGKWVIAQLKGPWRAPEWTPRPLRALLSQGWKRVAAERIVPKPPTRSELFIREFERRHPECRRQA